MNKAPPGLIRKRRIRRYLSLFWHEERLAEENGVVLACSDLSALSARLRAADWHGPGLPFTVLWRHELPSSSSNRLTDSVRFPRPAGLFRNSYCIHVSILRAVRKRVSVLVNLFKCMRARKDVAANPGVDFCAFLGHQTGLITHAVRP